MKSNAPWSVKGIERDARETAKEAARREGMTVGEWLNQVIYTASDPQTSNGEIEGLKISDLVTAIEHLNKRVIHAEFKGAAAIDDLARNFGGVVERLQRVERTKSGEGGEAGEIVSADIEERLARLESKGADRQRIETLKALEKAVSQVAVQFDASHKTSMARMDATEKHLQQLATRIDTVNVAAAAASGQDPAAVTLFTDTIDTLQARIERAERIAQQAAELKTETSESVDAEFVERTGARLRVLGDEIKRGGDQIRSLETSIKKLSDQIDAAEKRSSEGVQKVAETISELKSQFGETGGDDGGKARLKIEQAVAAATRRTEDRISALQRSFENMIQRLETPGGVTAGQAAAIVAEEIRAAEIAPQEEPFETFDLDAEADEETAEESDEDAFAFDLDRDEEPAPSTETAAGEPAEQRETEVSAPTALDQPDGLDAILAELDGFATGDTSPAEAPPADAPSVIAAAAETAPPAAPTDFLKEARRAAKEAAERAAAEQTTRRRLTPKQRAILAAKIRRKRLSEQGLGPAPEAAPEAALIAASPEPVGATEENPAAPSLFARAQGAFAGLRARLPIGKTADDDKTDASDATAPAKGKLKLPGALQTAIAQVKTKPVTAALGVAILLAAAALFFLIKDLASGGKPETEPAVEGSVEPAEPRAVETAQVDATGDTTAVSVPAAPDAASTPIVETTTQPRDLYLDSVAKLKSAKNDGELSAAIAGLEQAAALGHPPAQLQLGELYKLGQGVPQDLSQARSWYERAANGGNVLAMHRIGVMAARGQGGPVDQPAAIQWFERASNLGLVDSQYNLGAIYHPGGDGSASSVQDAGKAYYWYSLAATNGDEQAGSLASGLAASLPAERRRELDAEVAAWQAETPDADANEVAPAS